MLSRTADNLFWLARYMERAENLARILDVAARLATLPTAYAGTSNEWESAIATAASTDLFHSLYDKANQENVVAFIVASKDNPSSIRNCIEVARTNARAVRTALTSEMWEIVNDAWLQMRDLRLDRIAGNDLTRFLAFVKQVSLRFDGAAYRTMLRSDHFFFERLGTYVERADNTARLLDVKYHVLLPEAEPVGGGLDYFQWTAILRAVSALTSFHWVYRENVKPWLVADFLILKTAQPRSLVSIQGKISEYLDELAAGYGRQGPSQRIARATLAGLREGEIEQLFQRGLHEFLTAFIDDNNRLGEAIADQYLR